MLRSVSDYRLPDDLRGTILEAIAYAKVRELIGSMRKFPAQALKMALGRPAEVRSLRKSLEKDPPSIIAEIKKASPSAGLLIQNFDPLVLALEYQAGGAAAISVVTEAAYFQGKLETIAHLRWNSRIPLLRKDFIIDSYQVYEARHAGADAVLLIAALLNDADLRNLRVLAEEYGMDALVEVHSERELERALASGATMIGVNNRDLRTFKVSLDNSLDLASRIPKEVLAVSESGIQTAEDIHRLEDAGYRGFLVGELLMRAPSPRKILMQLRAGAANAARSSS
ncbi:MAG: indole-3-glycerol phosphate synthase [Acidobacteria bacterium]|nr:indole-3-glycerol phosphate synthase [Acidobacteriota bacterium]